MVADFHRALARGLVAERTPAHTLAEWNARREKLLAALRAAAGDLPAERTPLNSRVLGALERPGLRIERLTFETRPGVAVTANAYVPTEGKGPHAAVLCVHGHWPQARVDPVVQARCLGLARLRFFVLALDAFGSGERGTTPGVAEYHGGLLGASLWPVGTPLWGLQLWDNVRALDYLQSRSEVDAERIGCTGASGGGNQTMYISAFDARIKAAAPVCSVGNFQAYLGRAACVDEVMLNALTVAEEGDLLAMVAPRALLVVNATRDAPQFSVAEAVQSIARARPVFELLGAGEKLRHVTVESGHDYNRQMREAMYGWFDRWLRDRGDGSPVPEPEGPLEDPAVLRCFPAGERSPAVATIVGFRHARALERVAQLQEPHGAAAWREWQERSRKTLERRLLRVPAGVHSAAPARLGEHDGEETWRLFPEPGIALDAILRRGTGRRGAATLLLDPDGAADARRHPLWAQLAGRGDTVMALDLRGTGASTDPTGGILEIPDHNLCEWALLVGRPYMGQWVVDARAAVDFLRQQPGVSGVRLVGWREGGLLASLAAAVDSRVASVAAIEPLATFTGDQPFHNQRMVSFVPGIMEMGDVPQLAALAAPRPVGFFNPQAGHGAPVSQPELDRLYAWPHAAYRDLGAPDALVARADATDAGVLAWLDEGASGGCK